MEDKLFKAILSMDSYNRGYKQGILGLDEISSIGDATVTLQSEFGEESEEFEVGFYAVAYTYDSQVTIAYRGSDDILWPLSDFLSSDDVNYGWPVGAGAPFTSQAKLAFEFYNQVAGGDPYAAAISVTGHSMGGGFAGLVGATYQKDGFLFDSMGYTVAAGVLWTEEFARHLLELPRDEYLTAVYGTIEDPAAPDFEGLYSIAIDEEVLHYGDITDLFIPDEPNAELSLGPDVESTLSSIFGDGIDVLDLHNVATLVIRMFADESEVGSNDWEEAAKYFWPVLYDNNFANLIGMSSIAGRYVDEATGAEHGIDTAMRTIIAYSALDSGTMPFGNTGIRALYNDANELGTVLGDPDISTAIEDFAADISRSFVQYSAHLAQRKISGGGAFSAVEGVVSISGGLLSVDFADDKWKMGTGTLPPMAAREIFMDSLSDTVSSGTIRTAMRQVYGSDTAGMIEKISFVISEDGGTFSLDEPSAGKAHVLIAEQGIWGGVDNVTASDGNDIILVGQGSEEVEGGDGNDIIDGGAGDDILAGQDGDDALIGGEGEDELYGGAGNDVLYADALLSGAEDEIYHGGNDYDVLDFQPFTYGLSYIIDDETDIIREYGNIFASDIREDLTLIEIEGFNLTDHKDYLSVTNNPNPFKTYTHGGNDEIEIHGTYSTVYAGAGKDTISVDGYTNTLHGDGGEDTIKVTGNGNEIFGGNDNDTIRALGGVNTLFGGDGEDNIFISGNSNIVYAGSGNDKISITGLLGLTNRQALLLDAEFGDRIQSFGFELDGGLKNISQETPWVTSGLIRYGVNQQGELVISYRFLNGELFVANYDNTLNPATSTAGITLGVYAGGAYAIYREKINYPYGITLQDTIQNLKTTINVVTHSANPDFDPLILDLDGDGVETLANSSIGVRYDFNGDGFAEQAGWVHSDDGFLVLDANDDGKITSDEMFGSATVSGYDALEALDTNTDGKIDVADTDFADLKVWRDLDQDAVTDSGELFTLGDLDIKSINVTPDDTVDTTQAGNTISATGTFTYEDDSTGETGEVLFRSTPYYSTWQEDIAITPEAEALPDLVGHGTIASLREAMSYDAGLITEVEAVLATMNTNDLQTLRDNMIPLLEEWMDSIPVPGGTPGTTPRADVAILATNDPLTGAAIEDYGIEVTDGFGTYWIRASEQDVLDAFDEPIERPTYEDLLAQNGWTALPGEVIQFFERWTGLNIPLGVEGGEVGSEAVDAAQEIFSSFWAELNTLAVRLAVQGPLATTFEGIAFDATKDKFAATSDAQLVPLFENLLSGSATIGDLEDWQPVLNVFLNDFERPGGLEISYAWIYQNVIAAFENVDPSGYSLNAAAEVLGVPAEQMVTSGTEDNDLFYMTSGNQTVDGGEGVDAYVFGENFGQDVVDDEDSDLGADHTDIIRFAHLNSDDVTLYRDGNNLIIDVNATSDQVVVTDQFLYRIPSLFGGYINTAHGVAEIVFADGTVWDRGDMAYQVSHPENTNDNILGTGQGDFLDGGEGNDKLTGGNEGDVYVFGAGYGQDQIADANESLIGLDNVNDTGYSMLIETPDVLYFKDIDLAEVEFTRVGNSNDLTVSVIGETDEVTIKNQFNASYTLVFGTEWFDRIEALVFADGESLEWSDLFPMLVEQSQTSGNDTIYGFSWEDTLDGGAGDDYLNGGNENDTYLFGRGSDNDTIEDFPADLLSGQTDTLLFADDIETTDIAIERGAGDDDIKLRIIDTDETVTLVNQAKQFATGSNFYEIEEIRFADNTVWDTEYLKETYLSEATTSGNDTIVAFTGHDTIVGGAGNDHLEGRGGGDVYIFDTGHGNDVISDYAEYITWDQEDTIDFQGSIIPDDVEFAKDGYDLIITYTATSDSIEVQKFFLSTYYRIEYFHFSDDTTLTDSDVITLALGGAPIVGTSSGETLTGNAGHNVIQGLGGNDTLIGDDGDDILDGGDGDDLLRGSGDNDVYTASAGHDTIDELSGTDTILFGEGITAEDLEITRVYEDATFQHLLIEWESNSILVENHFVDSSNVRVESLTFFDNSTLNLMTFAPVTKGTSGADHLIGETDSSFVTNDTIYGYEGNDTLDGRGGNDVLSGGAGNDTLEGDAGDDVYIYESGDDVIDETGSSQGADEIRMPTGVTSGDLTIVRIGGTNNLLIEVDGLGSITVTGQFLDTSNRRVEKITFESEADINLVGMQIVTRGSESADTINGDGDNMSVDDIIYGLAGADTIDARTGADLIYGGEGADSLIGNDGNDTIYGDAGADSINAGDDNDIVYGGNDGDSIFGGTGVDTLYGEAGNDTLNSGTGADSLFGGTGDDVYIIDNAGDIVSENASEGIDTVQTGSISYTLTANVENLTFTGSPSIHGTGNSLDNVITGNTGSNSLIGGDGNDTLIGGSGTDRLFGNNDNDTLDGGTGSDTMTGGSGNDLFIVESAGDVVNESVGEGTDTVQSSITYSLGVNVENLTLTGSSALNGTGNTLDNILIGNAGVNTLTASAGNDTLDGGADADSLVGGTGDDTFVIDNAGDVAVENASEGTDTVQSGIAYSLGTNFENLLLTGSSNINATGNSVANTLTGNIGANTLDGGTGADTMLGAAGNDVYIVDNVSDVLIENADEGADSVQSSVTYTISANIEALTLTGSSGIHAYGNAAVNTLTGNTGANTIDGGAGADTMSGGAGNDVYIVDDAGDTILENASEGTDVVYASVSHSLSANLENLILSGSASVNGTGNTAANSLTGNSGDNTLDGGAGNDTMAGGVGNDSYVIDTVSDIITELSAEGTDTVYSAVTYTLGSNLENAVLTGSSDLTLVGNVGDNSLTGNTGNNTLNGGAGADTMAGGAGNDTYLVDNASDVIAENSVEGTDAVQSSVTFTLSANVENLVLTGSSGIHATGNSLDNTIDGNTGNNTLTGAAGSDIYLFSNGDGDDILVDNAGALDQIVFDASVAVGTVVYTNTGNDLNIAYGTGTDTIVVKDFFDGTSNQIEEIIFSDATTHDAAYITHKVFGGNGTSGDDTLDGGSGGDTFSGLAGNDVINGFGGADTIDGGEGNDTIDGGTGADTMAGGTGDDTFIVDDAGDVVSEGASEGTDTVRSAIGYTLGSNIENLTLTGSSNINGVGNSLDNTLSANAGTNTLSGGAGNDTYIVNNTTDVVAENAAEGTDSVQSSVNFTLGANVENLTLTGTSNIIAVGNAVDNILIGNSGDNTLHGYAGNDTMIGGIGNDVYYVDDAGDVVSENASEGTDTVRTSISYTLGSTLENLTISTAVSGIVATGNTLSNTIQGGSGTDTIYGLEGNDYLTSGGTGADTLIGGTGDDTYDVVGSSNVIIEYNGEGTDTVRSSITYTLGDTLEHLALQGSSAINATGNSLDNSLSGNLGVNIITGGAGNDTLNGGGGADTLIGGTGDDVYIVDNPGDIITENSGEGNDTVRTSAINYTLSANLENLIIVSGSVNGSGSGSNNTITGNTSANSLAGGDGDDTIDGGGGTDTMFGGLGNDLIIVDSVFDVVQENVGEGTDTVHSSVGLTLAANVENLVLLGTSNIHGTGNTLDNTITANSGNNTLSGGAGIDVMIGGAGNDTYVVDNTGDVATENADEGTDLVQASVTYSLAANIENLTLTGASNINASGNSLNNTLTGNTGNNTLDGGGGVDTLIGGTGNDTYVIDDSGDIIQENSGTDTVLASVSYTLTSGLENITLTGTSNINATGTGSVNILTGNSGDNTLNGGGSADTMIGGLGNDYYVVDNTLDVVTENSAEGMDTVQSSVSHTLANHVESLVLTGVSALNATGNSLDNTITGNSAVNTISGGTGADTMIGAAGNDIYIVDNTGDVIIENASEGTDSVQSSVSHTLSAHVENLTLTGSSNIIGAGNSLDNTITANSGDNTLYGGDGNDVYIVNSIGDIAVENSDEGIDTVNSSVSYTIGDNIENLLLISGSGLTAGGNALSNSITGASNIDTIFAGAGDDTVDGSFGHDTLYGEDGNDLLEGGAGNGNDRLEGGAGNDILKGGDSEDTLYGGDNDDFLWGENGLDTMWGGSGADIFVFEAVNAYNNIDVIKDFSTGEGDAIDINNLLSEYDPLTEALTDFVLIETSGSNSTLKVDRDGTGGTYSFVQIATIEGVTGLTDEVALVTSGNLIVS